MVQVCEIFLQDSLLMYRMGLCKELQLLFVLQTREMPEDVI